MKAVSGTRIAKYHEVTTIAIVFTFTLSSGGFNTRRTCMLRSVAAVLDTAPDKDWDVGREVIGWGQVEWIVLLLLCEDDRGTYVSDG